jgi:predicted Holliday junction resolvase-like endonuclease
MKADLIAFYRIQRNIFGVCPRSGTIFRLSDCKVYLRTEPTRDWMDEIERESERLDRLEGRLDECEEGLREVARKKGRSLAMQAVRALDPVFSPRKLNPDDAKVLFHPVDYVVFKGMKSGLMKTIILLDRASASGERASLQRSVERAVETASYEWLTIRIGADGVVSEEE